MTEVAESRLAVVDGAEHSDEDGHPESEAGLADHVDDRGPGGEGLRGQGRRRGRHHRGQRQAHPDAGEEHAAKHARQ